jgi:hypothetical protein
MKCIGGDLCGISKASVYYSKKVVRILWHVTTKQLRLVTAHEIRRATGMTIDCLCIKTTMMGDRSESGTQVSVSFSVSHAQILCPLNTAGFYRLFGTLLVSVSSSIHPLYPILIQTTSKLSC